MFYFGPAVEVSILVQDLLIYIMFTDFGMCCSHMGHEEHRRVKGRILDSRNWYGICIFSGVSIGPGGFDGIFHSEEVPMEYSDICRGSLNVLFPISVGGGLFAFISLVFTYERAYLRAGGVASLVGPAGGDAAGSGRIVVLRQTSRTSVSMVTFGGVTAVVVCLAADPALSDGHMFVKFL